MHWDLEVNTGEALTSERRVVSLPIGGNVLTEPRASKSKQIKRKHSDKKTQNFKLTRV